MDADEIKEAKPETGSALFLEIVVTLFLVVVFVFFFIKFLFF